MRKLTLIALIFTGTLFWLFFQFNTKNTTQKTSLKPWEFHFFLKNYPNGTEGLTSFKKGINQASEQFLDKRKNLAEQEKWRTVGPYNTGGRINTIAHHVGSDKTIYTGSVCGGIFKTTDGGKNWMPVFDEHAYLSIACIVLHPSDTNTLFAGTGDPNISGYPWIGNGIYKSSDGGNSWQHLGLDSVGIVTKIAVHPFHPDTIYAAAMGVPFVRNNHRGLYKSTNGGDSWDKVLHLSNDAGIIDLVLHPQHPDTIFTAGWNRIRNNRESITSGKESKIYRSFNGGNNWDTLTIGQPGTEMSRIGLYATLKDSFRLVAQVVNPTNFETDGLYHSNNFGDSWENLTGEGLNGALGGFGWYFGKVRVNPWNPDQYYVLGVDLHKSDDGGNSFEISTPPWYEYDVHADKHDMVFIDSTTFLLATDGGLYKTIDGGQNWDDIDNIPNTQFYRIAVDPHHRDYYAGGAQDNGTNYGTLADSNNWDHIFGGDGFQPLFSIENPELIYAETQNGNMYYGIRSETSENIDWNVFNNGLDEDDRRSWDMPIVMNPYNNAELYTGTYRVYKNSNAPEGGWAVYSDDLTSGINSRYHVITALDGKNDGNEEILVGTSDGNLHVFYNSVWQNITRNLPVRYITDVKISTTRDSVLFVTHSGYKDYENIPHVHFSDDLGTTWYNISGNLPQLAVNSIVVPKGYNDSVIFVATDGGVYHSLNKGETWDRTGVNMPVIPVYDLAYDDSNHYIVAGTFARSMMVADLSNIIDRPAEPSGIFEKRYGLKAFPNPLIDEVNIVLNKKINSGYYQLLSINGQIMQQYPVKGESEFIISLNDNLTGIYFLNIFENNRMVTSVKLIKK